jgi:hypothetical protein
MAARTRTCLLRTAGVLAGLVLAGCANAAELEHTATPEDALGHVQAVAAKVTKARSAKLSMTERTIFAGEQVAATTATTVGAYDYAAHRGQIDTTIKTAGIPLRSTIRTRVIGSTIYFKMPDPPQNMVDGGPPVPDEQHKPWIKLEVPRGLARQGGLGTGAGPIPDAGGGDPTMALWYLQAAARKAELVGTEQVRGTSTSRYTVMLDAAKVAAQAREEFQDFAEESSLAFPKPADVWIDPQGRPRKIHYTVTMKPPDQESPGPMTIDTTLELYDFGVPVHISPPPADQVEVIRPGPGCTEKDNGLAGSSTATTTNGPGSPTPSCPQG